MEAYNELYIDEAMENLGVMIEYIVCDLGFDPDEFFNMFITSGYARLFGHGNPQYTAGMSGYELALLILRELKIPYEYKEPTTPIAFGREYWAGWILAYYQWKTNQTFEDIEKYGLSVSTVLSMYDTLHEADVSKFVECANEIIARNKNQES